MIDLEDTEYIKLFFADGRKENIETVFDIPDDFTGILECADGDKVWYKEGMYHREDGPAYEYADGDKVWYKEGEQHRNDGPAVEWADGDKVWCKEGHLHREDGPAIEYADGRKYWWLDSIEYHTINLKDYIVLDEHEGKFNLIWYKLLGKDKVIEYPDIPGLITKE